MRGINCWKQRCPIASSGVKRAALALLPADQKGSELLLANQASWKVMTYTYDLAAMLRASELPETDELYFGVMGRLAQNPEQSSPIPGLNAATKIYFREQNNEDIDKNEVVIVIPSAEEEAKRMEVHGEKTGKRLDRRLILTIENGNQVAGVFGNRRPVGLRSKLAWTSDDIWMRRTFTDWRKPSPTQY